jgi:CheY-like chemotaxis protein
MLLNSNADQSTHLCRSTDWQAKDDRPTQDTTGAVNDLIKQRHILDNSKILIVDGDANTCHLFTLVLEETGAEVTIARSCHEALHRIEQQVPDIIICEIALPDETGFSFIHKAKELMSLTGHKMLALAVTIYAQDEARSVICAGGFQGHLSKPVDIYELVNVTADLIRHKFDG